MVTSQEKTAFIPHLHAFRGFAILTIVCAHSWSIFIFSSGGLDIAPGAKAIFSWTEALFHGSTLYFALISGVLFTKVLKYRGWIAFYRSKFFNVLVPYIILSILFLSLFWGFYVEFAEASGKTTFFPIALLQSLVTGSVQLHFWYIPVLIVLFALTPVLDFLQRHEKFRWCFYMLCLAPIAVSRTTYPNLLSFQTFVFFTGAYAFGMLIGEHYEQVLATIGRFLVAFWIAVIGSTCLLGMLFLWEFPSTVFFSSDQGLFYMQKIAFTGIVLHYFAMYENSLPRFFHFLGYYAFSIYFLHLTFAFLTAKSLNTVLGGMMSTTTILVSGFVILLVSVLISLGVSILMKRIFRQYSRMVIGA